MLALPKPKMNISIKHWIFGRGFVTTWLGLTIAVCVLLITPSIAFGFPFFDLDIGKMIISNLNGIVISGINALFYNSMNSLKGITADKSLTADWANLFGSSTVHDTLTGISNSVIKPIAGTILSCVFLMQFIKIAGKGDSQGTFPLFREIIVLFLLLSFFTFLVGHADDICGMIYSEITKIGRAFSGSGWAGTQVTPDFIGADWGNEDAFVKVNFGNAFFLLLGMLGMCFGAFIASIVVVVMVFARAIQLYIMACFSPIPFSVLGFEETRSWGVGYFKNFAAVALGGAILLAIIFIFPHIVGGVLGGSGDLNHSFVDISALQNSSTDLGSGIQITAKCIAICIVFIMGCIKSGAWAKDILGS